MTVHSPKQAVAQLRKATETILYAKVTSYAAVDYEELTDALLVAVADMLDSLEFSTKREQILITELRGQASLSKGDI